MDLMDGWAVSATFYFFWLLVENNVDPVYGSAKKPVAFCLRGDESLAVEIC